MADTLAPIGAHTAATSPDSIQLHMQALNSLSRCKAMLTAREPMYGFAQQHLEAAQEALAALQAIATNQVH